MEQRITDLVKSLKTQNEISDKNHDTLYQPGLKPGMLYGLGKNTQVFGRWNFNFSSNFTCNRHVLRYVAKTNNHK